jgi:hypothetical protein
MQRAVFNVPGQTLPSGLVRRVSLLLLSCLVWLVPAPLWAQPFDLARVRRSVVRVIANRGRSIGSGSILTVAGNTAYVLTAYHVIKEDVENDVSRVQVELFTEEVLEARISRRRIDTVNDLAVLTVPRLPSPPPPAISWGRSAAIRETQRVFALGHPLGGPGWAVTDGTVSRRLGGFIHFSGTAVSPGFRTWRATPGSGCRTGMTRDFTASRPPRRKTPSIRRRQTPASCAVAGGTFVLPSCARLTATGSRPSTATPTSDSAVCWGCRRPGSNPVIL